MTVPRVNLPALPPNTIVPESDDLFFPYLNRLYEDIAFTVNNKDSVFFPANITDTATNIPNVANFGSFIICISGSQTGLPTLTASLCKASSSAAGSIAVLGSQAGTTGVWSGATLTITSTLTNFQVKHSVASTNGNFNIKVIGTQ